MNELINSLEKWQTLIGALVGAVISLFVALIVARSARRREDVAAAMLVIGGLSTIRAAHRALTELAQEEKIAEEHLPYWLSEKLARRRVTLSAVFEASRVRLMPVDVHLAVHLELFQVIFSDIHTRLDLLERDIASLDSSKKTIRNPDALKADALLIQKGFEAAAAHAKCAEHILTLKVLSNFPTFHAIRMRLFGTRAERSCRRQFSIQQAEQAVQPDRREDAAPG
jgi:hypothetical protein